MRKMALLLAAGVLTAAVPAHMAGAEEETSAVLLAEGEYRVPEGWSEDSSGAKGQEKVYKRTEDLDLDETSTITCSYLETNYSVFEYEQLRNMLTNDLVYRDVDASISSNCTYTDSKDYLFVLTADDDAKDYREIYYYVVGDQECFLVEVREYRNEAQQQEQTPEDAGEEIASGFTW